MKQFDPPHQPPPPQKKKNPKKHNNNQIPPPKNNNNNNPSYGQSTFNFNPIKYSLSLSLCVSLSHLFLIPRQDLDAHPSEPATLSPCDGPKLCLFQPVTEEEIRKLVVESPTKTCILDPIPTSLTKECLSDLLPLITRIVNSSLCSGVVPLQFKQAVVTPLLKKPGLDPNDLKNFDPCQVCPSSPKS